MAAWASLVVVLLFSCLVLPSFAATIADGYAANPNSCVFLSPGQGNFSFPTYRLAETFWGEVGFSNLLGSVVVGVYNTYTIDGDTNPNNYTEGRVFVPSRVTLPLGWCITNGYQYAPIDPSFGVSQPSECTEPLQLYGYEDIVVSSTPDTTINSPSQQTALAGYSVSRLDQGSPFLTSGTQTFFNNPACNSTTPSYQIYMNVTGLANQDNLQAIMYTDSNSGLTKPCAVYGLGCDAVARPTGSATFDPGPQIVPVCRQFMPYNSSFDSQEYEALFNQPGYRAPTNVPLSAIVYQIRVANLPSPMAIYNEVFFDYVNGSSNPLDTVVGPFYPSFNNVYFVASLGTYPAMTYVRWYNPTTPRIFVASEALLGYLPPCNCNATSPGYNVPCDQTSFAMNETVQRNSVPAWNEAVTFISPPSCPFYVNLGSPPVAGVVFSVQSGAQGGVGPILYAWQMANLPPSAYNFFSGTDTATITLRIDVAVTFTMVSTVWTLNGPANTCTQEVTVIPNAPVAVVIPTVATIFTDTIQTLDGTNSHSLDGTPITFRWSQVFPASPLATLSSTSGAVITFTASVPTQYIILMNVTSFTASSTANVILNVVTPSAALAPGTPPAAIAPYFPDCYPFVTPIDINLPPSSTAPPPPLDPIPGIPPPPPPGTPTTSSPTGSIFGPLFPPSTPGTISILGLLIGLFVVLGVFVCVCARMLRVSRSNPGSAKAALMKSYYATQQQQQMAGVAMRNSLAPPPPLPKVAPAAAPAAAAATTPKGPPPAKKKVVKKVPPSPMYASFVSKKKSTPAATGSSVQ